MPALPAALPPGKGCKIRRLKNDQCIVLPVKNQGGDHCAEMGKNAEGFDIKAGTDDAKKIGKDG